MKGDSGLTALDALEAVADPETAPAIEGALADADAEVRLYADRASRIRWWT